MRVLKPTHYIRNALLYFGAFTLVLSCDAFLRGYDGWGGAVLANLGIIFLTWCMDEVTQVKYDDVYIYTYGYRHPFDRQKIAYGDLGHVIAKSPSAHVVLCLFFVKKGTKLRNVNFRCPPDGVICISTSLYTLVSQMQLLRIILRKRPDLSPAVWNAVALMRREFGFFKTQKRRKLINERLALRPPPWP
jgi:hypothetical protein